MTTRPRDWNPETLAKYYREKVPFVELLKIRPTAYSLGHTAFEMTVEERHLRTLGLMHGGVTATLLDTAMGMAAGTRTPEGMDVVTVQLNINYIRPAWDGETLIATGDVLHGGRQTAVVRGELRTSQNVLVASGSGTFMYIPRPPEGMTAYPKQADLPERA